MGNITDEERVLKMAEILVELEKENHKIAKLTITICIINVILFILIVGICRGLI